MKSKTKSVIASILAGTMFLSYMPSLKYSKIKRETKKDNTYITLNNDTNDICKVFAENVRLNKNLSEEEQELVIKSFAEGFLKDYAIYLDEESIIKLCTSARTVDVKFMNELILNHAWWAGSFNPFTNTYSVAFDDEELCSHEQLHAALRNNMHSTGLTSYLFGYALNEGAVSMCNKGNDGYYEEEFIITQIGLIIGYENLIDIILNKNIKALIEEISKYTTKFNAIRLVSLLDLNIFSRYEITSSSTKYADYDQNDYVTENDVTLEYGKRYVSRYNNVNKIISEMFEKRFGTSISESNLGKFIINSDLYDLGKGSVNFYYALNFTSDGNIKITTFSRKSKLGKAGYLKPKEEYIYSIEELNNIDFNEWYDTSKEGKNYYYDDNEKEHSPHIITLK